ncbi:MAG: hypothetical protein GY761_03165 [Hyphomicrobiales bacterium]|nr:hypothetical protein [Hyphomicrobiales bacterium]
MMSLEWIDRKEFKKDIPGWNERSKTPAGTYKLDYLRNQNNYLLQFECRKIGEFTFEIDAKHKAQDHFNCLVNDCIKLVAPVNLTTTRIPTTAP